MKYELEKVRMWYEKEWIYTTIKASDNKDELLEIAKKTKITFGKTFEEKLVLNEMDEWNEPYDVEVLKDFFYDRTNKMKPTLHVIHYLGSKEDE